MISLSSQYALQALAHLSIEKRPMLSKEISNDLSISPSYMTKILQTLRQAKILKATRGSKGGFEIAIPPSEITFMKVISLFEDPAEWVKCPFGQMICHGDPLVICKLHCKWEKISHQFIDFLNASTISAIKKQKGASKKKKA